MGCISVWFAVQHRAGIHCREPTVYFDPQVEAPEGMQRMATFQEISEDECETGHEHAPVGVLRCSFRLASVGFVL